MLRHFVVLGGLLGTRVGAAPSGQFGLYAYGGGIGGAQVFYSNDVAYIGDQAQMDDEEAARVSPRAQTTPSSGIRT
ncbi:hypothetical protein NUW58_g3474 [Xylaria curta]|uniref:Uncharacterized protein n=1 Tax=Xylaria curta TaxID=42375 RepID=A0ACC1PC51_9PEZI|nr:hypothetical protein NUW58_g3474 [Xylaria curta]